MQKQVNPKEMHREDKQHARYWFPQLIRKNKTRNLLEEFMPGEIIHFRENTMTCFHFVNFKLKLGKIRSKQ